MNKIIILIVIVIAALLAFLLPQGTDSDKSPDNTVSSTESTSSENGDITSEDIEQGMVDNYSDEDGIMPAYKLYKSKEEALKAARGGVEEYDDLVIEQFADMGKECKWCPEFYEEITESMLSMDASEDEQSYFSEILAVSNRVENIKTLVDAIEGAPNQETADTFAESLELTMGDDKIVSYLAGELETDNEELEEAVVAAITNHGSRMAVEQLYNHAVESGDPDGMYSLGIGLGEVIPEDSSIPYLTEMMGKGNDYSPLAAKALLNADDEGFKIVADYASTIRDEQKLDVFLTDAIDHVIISPETEEYVKQQLKKDNPKALEDFYNEVLEEANIEREEDLEDEEDDY